MGWQLDQDGYCTHCSFTTKNVVEMVFSFIFSVFALMFFIWLWRNKRKAYEDKRKQFDSRLKGGRSEAASSSTWCYDRATCAAEV